tara:strand:+ start:1132 stop:1653 length:522 start_codon:yes stop_codon:yes gene_type:complete
MKRVLSIIIFLVSISLSAQKIADYNKLDGSYFGKKYDVYITKSRDTVRVGDSLVIGKTSTDSHFKFINQANQFGGSQLSGHGIKIKKMIVEKFGKNREPVLWIDFRGWGLYPVYIAYEQALEEGELLNPNGTPTRKQAIEQLKEAKTLYDLEVIDVNEYEAIKTKLTPIIINK